MNAASSCAQEGRAADRHDPSAACRFHERPCRFRNGPFAPDSARHDFRHRHVACSCRQPRPSRPAVVISGRSPCRSTAFAFSYARRQATRGARARRSRRVGRGSWALSDAADEPPLIGCLAAAGLRGRPGRPQRPCSTSRYHALQPSSGASATAVRTSPRVASACRGGDTDGALNCATGSGARG